MKRIICFVLVLALALAGAACGREEEKAVQLKENQIIDGSGAVKDLPKDPGSATIASVYAVSVPFISALGLSERTVAVNPKTKFWNTADEALSKNSIGRGVVDLEALARYNPTVLIHRSNDPETVAAVENLGVDVLCITVEGMDDIRSTLEMLGRYFGAEERAEEVAQWMQSKFDMIAAVTSQIPEENKVTALMMGGELGRIAGNDMLQSWMIEQAGGKCVADEGKDHNWINVGVEKIFEWNPEFIFCTSSTGRDYDESDMLSDKAWSAVSAVKSGSVYVVPAKIDSWDIPGLSCVLGTMYMLHAMYPELFSAQQLQAEIDDYYNFMFGKTFSPAELGYDLNEE